VTSEPFSPCLALMVSSLTQTFCIHLAVDGLTESHAHINISPRSPRLFGSAAALESQTRSIGVLSSPLSLITHIHARARSLSLSHVFSRPAIQYSSLDTRSSLTLTCPQPHKERAGSRQTSCSLKLAGQINHCRSSKTKSISWTLCKIPATT